MLKTINYNRRSIFYSIIIVLGLIFMMNIESRSPSIYLFAAIALYIIILFEMYYIWFISKEKLRQFDLPLMTEFSRLKQIVHHLLLPTLLYISFIGFIYVNNQISLRIPIILLSFISFLYLFINLRAFYQDKYSLEKKTYWVYDVIEMIIFFILTNFIIAFSSQIQLGEIFIIISVSLLNLTLLMLNLYQVDQLKFRQILFIVFQTIIFALLISLILTFNFSPLSQNFFFFLCYYFMFGLLTHHLDSSLNLEIILEYISIFLICLAIFFGIF